MIMMKNMVLMTIDVMMAIGKLCGGVPPSRGDIPLLYIADEHYTDNKMGNLLSWNYICSDLIVYKSPPALVASYN